MRMNFREMLLAQKLFGGSGGGALVVTNDLYPNKNMPLDDLLMLHLKCNNTKTFEYESFFECTSIEEIVAPMAETVEERAFLDAQYLKRVDMPKVTYVGIAAFAGCDYLTEFNLPCVKTLDDEAFALCWLLKTIDLPMAENIGTKAFWRCSALTTVILRTTETVCVCALDAFEDTPIMRGLGHIYVPAVMYEYYRAGYEEALNAAAGAGAFDILFRKIEDYPEICG